MRAVIAWIPYHTYQVSKLVWVNAKFAQFSKGAIAFLLRLVPFLLRLVPFLNKFPGFFKLLAIRVKDR